MSLARIFGSPALAAAIVGTPAAAEAGDPLAALDDDFEGGETDVEDRGWSWYKEGAVATQTVADGELDLEITAGGGAVGGATSFWFSDTAVLSDGVLLYKEVTGPFDARLRCRVRNTANDANPPVTSFRIFGLAAHDPTRTSNVFNYLHIGAGSAGAGDNRIEWKTTDDDGGGSNDCSAFGSASAPAGDLDVDLRIVRTPDDPQVFELYYRASAGDLLDDTGWTLLNTIDRTDNTQPDRDATGASANLAVELPDTLQVGICCYSNQTTHNVRGFVEEFRVRTPLAEE